MNSLFSRIWAFILGIFGKKSIDRITEQKNINYSQLYENEKRISFEAIMSTALSNRALSDSHLHISDGSNKQNRTTEWLNEIVETFWKDKVDIVSQALGKGGKVFVPYIVNGKGHVDVVDHTRMRITRMESGKICDCTILAEMIQKNDRWYYRFVDYTMDGTTQYIRTRITSQTGAPVALNFIEQWADIESEITIENTTQALIGYLKCPQDSRKDEQIYGVPITYGSEKIIGQLQETLKDMEREFRTKKAFVGADERLFGKDNMLPDEIFKKFNSLGGLNGNDFWQVFDPAFRDSSYLARFHMLCGLLEQSVGVSAGILTEPKTAGATATEIKASQFATYTMVNAIRENIETAMDDVVYALDVLGDAFGVIPSGDEYKIDYDWDTSAVESTQETFQQLSELQQRNLITAERLVAWVTGLTFDEAKAEVETATAQAKTRTPTLDNFLL